MSHPFFNRPLDPKVHCNMCHSCLFSDLTGCCVSTAISAPLKLKASRGPPTPINRNQASQPRVGQSLLGKRGFDSVSSLHTTIHIYSIEHKAKITAPFIYQHSTNMQNPTFLTHKSATWFSFFVKIF